MRHNHKSARQYSDQMVCTACRRSWDVNDDDPPPCEPPPPSSERQENRKRINQSHWDELKENLK